MMPSISVILTAYNYAHTLEGALESVLAQDHPNFEVLLLDNASTDATPAIAARFADLPNVRYIRHPENIGMMANHNAGIRLARGTYTTFLAADNIMMPGYLRRAERYLHDHPELDLVYSGIYLMSKSGRILHRRRDELQAPYCGGRDELPAIFAFGCDMQIESMLVTKRLWQQHGLFDESLIAADNEIITRWACAGARFGYDPEPFIAFRIHAEQQSSVANYTRTGRQLNEYLELFSTYVLNGDPERFRGFEHTIARGLERKVIQTEGSGCEVSPATRDAVDSAREQLLARARGTARSPRVPAIDVVVLAGDSLYALEHSLRSLLTQDDSGWNALVVQQPGTNLAAFCRLLDRCGRIRVVALDNAASESSALNTAITISGTSHFAFLRAGNAFAPGYIRELRETFGAGHRLVTAATQLVMTAPDLASYLVDDAFPARVDAFELLLAPAVPLDALAFARDLIDEFRSFHLEYAANAHWELLMRLSRHETPAHLQSAVQLHTILGFEDPLLDNVENIASALKFYDCHPVRTPELNELRRRYLHDLERTIAFEMSALHTPHQRRYAYRMLTGAHLLPAAATV